MGTVSERCLYATWRKWTQHTFPNYLLSVKTATNDAQVDHVDLGVSGGLSGVARNGGGVVALTVCLTILTNVQGRCMKQLVPPAALAAGLPSGSIEALLSALPLGESALSQVPGATQQVLGAALGAFLQSYVVGLR
jgi:hypothetical protein